MDNKTIEERAYKVFPIVTRLLNYDADNNPVYHDANEDRRLGYIAALSEAPAALPMTREEAIKWGVSNFSSFAFAKAIGQFYDHLAALANPGGEESELEQLRRWKKEQTYLMDKLDLPEIGKQIGVGLGQKDNNGNDAFESLAFFIKGRTLDGVCQTNKMLLDQVEYWKNAVWEHSLPATPSPVPGDVEGDRELFICAVLDRVEFAMSEGNLGSDDLINFMRGNFPTAAPEPWVRVEDGLPEGDWQDWPVDCLVCLEKGEMFNAIYRPAFKTWSVYYQHGLDEIKRVHNVTHWMRLPAPPKH